MIIGTQGSNRFQLVDPDLGHTYQPFPASELVLNMETFALEGGQTISIPRSYDRGSLQIKAQIWQADDETARALFEDLADYVVQQHVGLRQPVPVVFRDGVGNAIDDATMTSGSDVLQSASGVFTSTTGQQIAVLGAGAGGGLLRGTIQTFTNSTHVVLSVAAGATLVSGVAVWGGRYDGFYFIDTMHPTFDSEFPGRIPLVLTMRRIFVADAALKVL